MASSNMYIQTTPNLHTHADIKPAVNQLNQNNVKFNETLNYNGDRNINVKNVNAVVDVTNNQDINKVNKSHQQPV